MIYELFHNPQKIWELCFYFCYFTLLLFYCLVLVRFFRSDIEKRRNRQMAFMRKEILINLNKPLKNIKIRLVQKEKDLFVLADVVGDLLKNLKGDSRKSVLKMLENIGFYDWLVKKLRNGDIDRFVAINILRYWIDNKEVKNLLFNLLRNSSSRIAKVSIASSLCGSHDDKMIAKVLEYLQRDKDISFLLLTMVIESIEGEKYNGINKILSKSDFSIDIKMAALNAVSGDFSSTDMNLVVKYCKHQDPRVRILAYNALSKGRTEVPIDVLYDGARDSEYRVRKYTARIACYNAPESLRILSDLIDDESWVVGLEAAKSMFSCGKQGIILLKKFSESYSIRGKRAQMLLMEKVV